MVIRLNTSLDDVVCWICLNTSLDGVVCWIRLNTLLDGDPFEHLVG